MHATANENLRARRLLPCLLQLAWVVAEANNSSHVEIHDAHTPIMSASIQNAATP